MPACISVSFGSGQPPGGLQKRSNHLPDWNKLAFPQLAVILAAPGLQNYFLQCVAPVATPQLTPFSAWALRHEYHLQYLALTLAQRAVGVPKPPIPVSTCTPIPILLLWNLCCFWQAMQFLFSSRHAQDLCPAAHILFAYILFLTSLCFVPSHSLCLPPLHPCFSVHRQHSSQYQPPELPSIMAWPWPC